MNESFIGVITPMAFSFAPRGWMSCEGQLLSIAQYSALFSLLGTLYGGDGRTTFALPDLRGRRIIGQGSSSVGTYRVGEKAGAENTTVLLSQLPTHIHTIAVKANVFTSDNNDPSNAFFGGGGTNNYTASVPDTTMNAAEATSSMAGGNQLMNIQAPYLAMYCNICTQGLFPSRN
jgi:microcystin-dependent protein